MATRKRPTPGSLAAAVGKVRELQRAEAEAEQDGAEAAYDKMTFYLPADLVNELRAASLELPPKQIGRRGLSSVAERALRRELEALRRDYHGGEPFPVGEGERPRARTGRPPKLR